jgi:hypothetical protein
MYRMDSHCIKVLCSFVDKELSIAKSVIACART